MNTNTTKVLRLATRKSPLALRQSELVAERLRSHAGVDEIAIVEIESDGDTQTDVPIRSIRAIGVFTTAIDRAVADGRADIAVHSAKDLPSSEVEGPLVLAAVPERQDVRDVLVGSHLLDLEPGAVIATGAVRRRVQLAFVRPDLGFCELRGNIASRLAKVPANGAVVVAAAALRRLDIPIGTAEVLSLSIMLPQIGQGAIALRCHADDNATRRVCEAIDDVRAHRAVVAERAFLREIGGGCDAPVGAYARCASDDEVIEIEAMIARHDGHALVRGSHRGHDPETVGIELARLLVAKGANQVLGDVVVAP